MYILGVLISLLEMFIRGASSPLCWFNNNVFDSFKHAIQAQAPDRVLPHATVDLHCVPAVYSMHLQIHMVDR